MPQPLLKLFLLRAQVISQKSLELAYDERRLASPSGGRDSKCPAPPGRATDAAFDVPRLQSAMEGDQNILRRAVDPRCPDPSCTDCLGCHGKNRSLQHIESFLSGIFRLADQQGYYDGANPVRETSLPHVRPSDETYAYSLEEVLTMIDAVPEPASTLIAAAAFTGARRGELRGMFWENYQNGELLIARSIWNGITTDSEEPNEQGAHSDYWPANQQTCISSQSLGNPTARPVFPNGAKNAVDPVYFAE
jgi:hypothetical protein